MCVSLNGWAHNQESDKRNGTTMEPYHLVITRKQHNNQTVKQEGRIDKSKFDDYQIVFSKIVRD